MATEPKFKVGDEVEITRTFKVVSGDIGGRIEVQYEELIMAKPRDDGFVGMPSLGTYRLNMPAKFFKLVGPKSDMPVYYGAETSFGSSSTWAKDVKPMPEVVDKHTDTMGIPAVPPIEFPPCEASTAAPPPKPVASPAKLNPPPKFKVGDPVGTSSGFRGKIDSVKVFHVTAGWLYLVSFGDPAMATVTPCEFRECHLSLIPPASESELSKFVPKISPKCGPDWCELAHRPDAECKPTETPRPIAPGDVVRLKSGGLPMTVSHRDDDGSAGDDHRLWYCVWFKPNGEIGEDSFFDPSLFRVLDYLNENPQLMKDE